MTVFQKNFANFGIFTWRLSVSLALNATCSRHGTMPIDSFRTARRFAGGFFSSSIKFRVGMFEFWVEKIEFWEIQKFVFRVENIEFRVEKFEFRAQKIEFRVEKIEFRKIEKFEFRVDNNFFVTAWALYYASTSLKLELFNSELDFLVFLVGVFSSVSQITSQSALQSINISLTRTFFLEYMEKLIFFLLNSVIVNGAKEKHTWWKMYTYVAYNVSQYDVNLTQCGTL